jgi:hypothetical protein
MIPRFPVFLFALFVWSLIPGASHGLVRNADSSGPTLQSQKILPLALKYRERICQVIESGSCQFTFLQTSLAPNHQSDPLVEVALLPARLSDPCYSFMSLQL